MTAGVYEILNTVDGKRYIGSARDFDRRWREHQLACYNGTHRNSRLQNAWNKHSQEWKDNIAAGRRGKKYPRVKVSTDLIL